MAKYTIYTEEQIVEALEGCGFERVGVAGTRETVMEREVEGKPGRRIRVYTSAVKGEVARDCGEDAARVLVMVRIGGPADTPRWQRAWVSKRVHRTENFLANLKQRCRDAWKTANTDCPTCGDLMVPRRRKGAKKDTFWGCTRYPECRATANM